MKVVSILFIFISLLSACKEDGPCTEEFRMLGVEVRLDSLDDHYTIEIATGDTLRFNSYQHNQWYAVMTDQYRDYLKNETRTYRFEGMLNGKLRVSGLFEIGADDCHIYKISGPDSL